jgi:hypothetical protein
MLDGGWKSIWIRHAEKSIRGYLVTTFSDLPAGAQELKVPSGNRLENIVDDAKLDNRLNKKSWRRSNAASHLTDGHQGCHHFSFSSVTP